MKTYTFTYQDITYYPRQVWMPNDNEIDDLEQLDELARRVAQFHGVPISEIIIRIVFEKEISK